MSDAPAMPPFTPAGREKRTPNCGSRGHGADGAVAEARLRELPRLGSGCSEGVPCGDSSKEGGCQGDDASSGAAAVTTAAAHSSAASSAIP